MRKGQAAARLPAAELRRLQTAMEHTRALLDECRDPGLIEAAVLELKYLEARYVWQLDAARESAPSGGEWFME